jgi:YVTN family beta-propeller protein
MNKAYVTNTDSDDISVVDLDERREISRLSIGGSPRGSVRFDPEKNFGYVSNCAGNTISVIDLHRNREVAKITVGLAPRGLTLSPDGRHAFVSNSGENTLSVVDLVERRELRKYAMGENPRHMAFLPQTNRLLVTQWGSDTVASFDLAGGPQAMSSLPSVPVGSGARPYSLTATRDGRTAYVANTQADYLSVVDVATGTERARVEVGFGGRAAAFSPDERYVFLSLENSNEVVVIDAATNAVVKRVSVGPSPRGIAISLARMELYSSDFTRSGGGGAAARNALSVVDVRDPLNATLVTHIKVGLGPCSVSVLQ